MTSWCHKPPCDIQLEEEINRAEFNVHTSSSFEGVKAHVLADKILLRKIRFVYSELTYVTRVVIYIFKAIFLSVHTCILTPPKLLSIRTLNLV